jgi:hypothetical protein
MTIKSTVNNIEIQGEITHRSAGDISVEILRPFKNISGGQHIPSFARAIKSFEGSYGDEVAETLLTELYDIGKHLDAEIEMIREKLHQTREMVRDFSGTNDPKTPAEKRSDLRSLFKNGSLGQKEYHRELAKLNKEKDELIQKVQIAMDSFFESAFPMCVPNGTRDQVLDIIDGNESLVAS